MTKENFIEKIVILLGFLILNNYLLLMLNFNTMFVKVNYALFLLTILFFYFRYPSRNYFIKIFFLSIIFISLGTPVFEWDPRSNYLFHAKRIFYDNSIFSVSDNYALFSNNDYPTLIPAFAASLASLVGHWNEVFPKLAFTFTFLPPLILICNYFKKTNYIIFLSIVFFVIGKYLFNGWADGLIAFYFTVCSFLMYLLFIKDDKDNQNKKLLYIISFIFFITLTLIKNEGSLLLFILFNVVLFVKIVKKNIKLNIYKLLLLSSSFIPIILWQYFCFINEVGLNDRIQSDVMVHLLPRLLEFKNYQMIAYFLLLNEKFLICLLFFLISSYFNWNKSIFIFISLICVLYLMILFLIFLSTPYDFYFQLDSSASRVIKSLSFLLSFFALYNLSNKIVFK